MYVCLCSDTSGGSSERHDGQQPGGRGGRPAARRQRGAAAVARPGAVLAALHTSRAGRPAAAAVSPLFHTILRTGNKNMSVFINCSISFETNACQFLTHSKHCVHRCIRIFIFELCLFYKR